MVNLNASMTKAELGENLRPNPMKRGISENLSGSKLAFELEPGRLYAKGDDRRALGN